MVTNPSEEKLNVFFFFTTKHNLNNYSSWGVPTFSRHLHMTVNDLRIPTSNQEQVNVNI